MAHLRIERSADPGARGVRIPLTEGESTIGRGRSNTVVVADETMSRRHAQLEVTGAACVLRDLGSANGMLVNGERVTEAQLRDGDRIRLGSTVLVFEDAAGTVLLEMPPLGDVKGAMAEPPRPAVAPPTPPVSPQRPPASPPPPPMPPALAPAQPPVVPAARPTPPPPLMPTADSPRRRPAARWLAIGLAAAIPLLVAAGWVLLRATGGPAPAGGGDDLSTRPLLSDASEAPELPPIPIRRGDKLVSGRIADAAGGRLTTDDGLTIAVPPGALGGDRKLTIYEAEVPPPTLAVGSVGGDGATAAEVLRAWDIDAGPEDGLFPAAVGTVPGICI